MISSIYTTVCHGSSALGYSWQFSLAPPFSLAPLVRSISPPLPHPFFLLTLLLFFLPLRVSRSLFRSSTTPARDGGSFRSPRYISLLSLSLSLSLVHPERRLFSSLPLLDASCIVPLARRGSCAPRHPLRLPSNSPGHNPRDILPFRTRLTRKITERGSILSCRCLLTEGFNRRNRGISKF